MNDHSHAAQEIESLFTGLHYPDGFLQAYDQMECLSSRRGCESFLLKKKETGEYAIGKCYQKSVCDLTAMIGILKTLEHPGMPRYTETYENEVMVCLVREYVEGVTLTEYLRTSGLTPKESIGLCLELLDALAYLHERKEPIIHRDIKPDNIIIRPDGAPVLIDFDIARVVKAENETDTIFFGTRGYAPPEQYGFAQTDCRADIYAFGVLLRFLLTNSERPGKNICLRPELQRIIDRCTAFSPKDRYVSVKAVRRALVRVRNLKMPSRKRWFALSAAAVFAALCLGFALGRFTPVMSGRFQEPLIEAAVRAQLGVGPRQPLTEEMLARVQRIYIFGAEVFADPDAFFAKRIDDSTRGPIATLEDLALLPNLEEICIVHQGTVDLSGIEQATNLRSVELKHVRIRNVSRLADLPQLEHLGLYDSGIADLSALLGCQWLTWLDVGSTRIENLQDLGGFPRLRFLSLKHLDLSSLAGVEQLPKLETVSLSGASVGDWSALLLCPSLREVLVTEPVAAEVSAVLEDSGIRVRME